MNYTKYERVPYMAPGAKFEQVSTSIVPINVPVFDYPISPRENFRRVLKHENPMWVPTAVTDFNYVMGGELTGLPDLRFDFEERCDWTDLFGCVWEWLPDAGGSMLKPNQKPVLEDITEWEKKIVWPDLSEDRIKACCEKFMSQPYYHPEKLNYYDFGQGCTERLVAVLGGYTEAMLAFAEEPEACREFMAELSRFHCRMFDAISKYFPTDMIMYHDDWGTERDTFFGEKMMEEMVYGPSEIFFKHVKETGVAIDFHTCGNIKRFVKYAVELGADFLQLQTRCNDVKAYKEQYGDKIGFDVYLLPTTVEDIKTDARNYVDELGKNGGLFSTIFGGDETILWPGLQELYAYSREYYENN
ncbi:MAG: uroporphyrinogen decarboxylase family protein [Clostridiales bacterium]|nr:uroporphyrinogen decarboxylase family protein [Clostridiales bacterium]